MDSLLEDRPIISHADRHICMEVVDLGSSGRKLLSFKCGFICTWNLVWTKEVSETSKSQWMEAKSQKLSKILESSYFEYLNNPQWATFWIRSVFCGELLGKHQYHFLVLFLLHTSTALYRSKTHSCLCGQVEIHSSWTGFCGSCNPLSHYCGSCLYNKVTPSCIPLPFTSWLHPGLIAFQHPSNYHLSSQRRHQSLLIYALH